MRKTNRGTIVTLAIMTIAVFAIPACTNDVTIVINNPPPITRSVSFSADIIPILSANCTTSGCHSAGGHVPDLTTDKAYNSLVAGNYLNVSAAESSTLYLWLTGKEGSPMPLGAAPDPSSINELVLAWIKQGAKNN